MSTPATTPLTYNLYVQQLANMAVVGVTTVSGVVVPVDPSFATLIPQALNYAELRIQRDLDILPSVTTINYSLTPNNNILQLGVNDFVTVQTITISYNGNTYTLLPTTKEFLQNVYGSSGSAAMPQYFAMYGGDYATAGNTYNNVLLGPYPDNAYSVTVSGTIRMPTLGNNSSSALASTATTFISTYYPDLLIQASMIYVAQYQRNFGSASNDPSMGPTYELQYENLLKNALTEESRKRFAGAEWTSYAPTPTASIPRG